MSEERTFDAFEYIRDFVESLWDAYGQKKKKTPLVLYRRILKDITREDKRAVSIVVRGFEDFLNEYSEVILSGELDTIPRGTHIYYNDNKSIYIDIQQFIYRSANDEENRRIIHSFLVTISDTIKPTKKKKKALKQIAAKNPFASDGSKEGDFTESMFNKVQEKMNTIGDVSDPTASIMSLASSGLMTDLMQGFGSGDLDQRKVAKKLKSIVTSLPIFASSDEESDGDSDDDSEEGSDVE